MVSVIHVNYRLCKPKCLIPLFFGLFLLISYQFELVNYLVTCEQVEAIDVVYTWVNGSDPKFKKQLNAYLRKDSMMPVDQSAQRYDDKNELKYSLRSLEKFAPWVNHVYVVTNGQVPSWLDLDCGKVTIVRHSEIFEDDFYLPSFSSPAIEFHLHRIPGLSKRFIYFNDDVFLRSAVYREDFFSPNRGFLVYLAWLIPPCSLDCSWFYVADGTCDLQCNNPSCQMDGGDCDDTLKAVLGDKIVDSEELESIPIREKLENTNYHRILALYQNRTLLDDTVYKNRKRNMSKISSLIIPRDRLRFSMRRKRDLEILKVAPERMRVEKKRLDAYAASLQHTNRLLNRHYGFTLRKVPSHAPIMVDVEIMRRLHERFHKEIARTSRNRIRSSDDLQFSFLYYYFVIHEKRHMSVSDMFDEVDTDKSGEWSDTEVRTLVTKLYDLPLTDEDTSNFHSILFNCTKYTPRLYTLTKPHILACHELFRILSSMTERRKYPFEIIKDSDRRFVSFKMLNSNMSEVMQQLDDVRRNAKKFVCLNDNLDENRLYDNMVIKELMADFYEAFYPKRSVFELHEEYRNSFADLDEYDIILEDRQRKFIYIMFCFIGIVAAVFCNCWMKLLCKFIHRYILNASIRRVF